LLYGGGTEQLVTQAIGIVSVGVYVLAISAIAWFVIKMTLGLRVTAEEEKEGLDLGEHGNEAYHGFQFVSE
jgi:Amt family ammonium transporter